MHILRSGRYLRLSVAFAARGLRRALPLLEREQGFGEVAQDVRWLIISGAAFAAGAPQDHGALLRDLHPLPNRLDRERGGEPPGMRHFIQSARELVICFGSSAQGHLARPLATGTDRDFFKRAGQAVHASIIAGHEGLLEATDRSERNLVHAAIASDEAAFDHYKGREDARLGRPEGWLFDPTGEDVLGPPLEPSEGGPLGLLWPERPPGWFRDDMEMPEFVSGKSFLANPSQYLVASDIALFSTEGDGVLFERRAREFLADGHAVARPGKAMPPQQHIYLSDYLTQSSREDLFPMLTALGATVWRDSDFETPPGSEDAFISALTTLYRKTKGRGQLLALSPAQQLSLAASNGVVPPIPSAPSQTPPRQAGVSDRRWQPKQTAGDAYASVIERSRTATEDG